MKFRHIACLALWVLLIGAVCARPDHWEQVCDGKMCRWVLVKDPSSYEWRDSQQGQSLFRYGRLVGRWEKRRFQWYENGTWGPVIDPPPWQTPERINAPKDGVIPKKMPVGPAVDPFGKVVTGCCKPGQCVCNDNCQCAMTGQCCAQTGKPCFPMGLAVPELSPEPKLWLGDVAHDPQILEGDARIPDYSKLAWRTVWCRDPAKCDEVKKQLEALPTSSKFRTVVKPSNDIFSNGWKLKDDKKFAETGLRIGYQLPPSKPGGLGLEKYAAYTVEDAANYERTFDPTFDPNHASAGGSHTILWLAGAGIVLFLLLGKKQPTEENLNV